MIKFGLFWFYRRKFSNLHYFVINSPWQRVGPFIWINFTQGCFVLSIVEIGRQVLERKIFKLVNVFSLFHYYLPLEKGMALYLNKHELPSLKDTLCQVWMNWPTFSGEEDIFKLVNIFSLFIIISRWKRAGSFIWTNLNSLHPRILCAKFGWNLPSSSGEDFLNFVNVFLLFCNYLS